MRQQVLERLELRVELVDALDRGELALRYQPVVDLERPSRLRLRSPPALEPSGAVSSSPPTSSASPRRPTCWRRSGAGCSRSRAAAPRPGIRRRTVRDLGEREPQATRRRLVRHRRAPRPRPQSPDPQPSAARDHRLDAGRRPRRRPRVSCARCATWACAWPSTTSASGTSLEQLLAAGGRREVRSELRHVKPGRRLERVAGCHRFAHDLGLDTVGKGIENADQLAQLGAIGCRYAQGT